MRTPALLLCLAVIGCKTSSSETQAAPAPAARTEAASPQSGSASAAASDSKALPGTQVRPASQNDLIMKQRTLHVDQPALVNALAGKYGDSVRARAARGVGQVAAYWRPEDGDSAALRSFVLDSFVADPRQLDSLLSRFSSALEQVYGHLLEIGRALRSWSELELGPQMEVDQLFASLDVGAHVSEDLFANKLAFVALLNFDLPDLQEMIDKGPGWSRRQWAAVRLTRAFASRPTGAAVQAVAKASADAEAYIAGYNIWMHHVLGEGGARPFPKGMRLLTHWNLRDQIKADYAARDKPQALVRQRLMRAVMERIVTQQIPKAVIDDPRVDWDPATNRVTESPAAEVETEQMKSQGKRPPMPLLSNDREPDTRYQVWLDDFQAARKLDADSPMGKTEIERHFALDDEIPEERVRALLTQVLDSPLVPKVAALIQKRLGRPLEPFDIWYDGFTEKQPEEELSRLTRARYPTADAYKKDIPRLLRGLGFTPAKAAFLDSHIVVDPARGSGHALEAGRRSEMYSWWGPGDSPHLRTRINPDGMDYKGYNIAIHEMGHNVEQVFSLYEVDDTLLSGVPGTAFTEALAFTFQHRDLEVLGVAKPNPLAEHARALKSFWDAYEIAGSALVDLDAWHWMYDHPDATAAQFREAVVDIARRSWDRHFAKVLGEPGNPQLAIYSHMINSFLYLYRYPLGHLIAFQLEQKLRGKDSGKAFERAASFGHVTPDLWMQHATGRPVVAEPMLEATAAALQAMDK
jgi:hypothetical protein